MTEQTVYFAPREWTRLHPISPILKGWPAALAVGGWWFYTAGPAWLGGGSDTEIPDEAKMPIWVLIPLAVIVALIAIVFSYVAWRFNRYRISDDAIEQHKGVLFRQQRQARLDRLQAVDVVQPFVARIFGFAKLSIEVAGGDKSGVTLEFLRLGDAEALRNEVLALAAGRYRTTAVASADAVVGTASVGAASVGDVAVATGVPARAPSLSPDDINPLSSRTFSTQIAAEPDVELYAVPFSRLAGSILRSWGAMVAVAFIPVAIALAVVASQNVTFREALLKVVGGSLAGVVGAATGLGTYFFAILNRGFNFRAGIAPDGIRLRHGLLETRRQTVPPGRVQAVRLRQSLLWRRKGWWEIQINVAGYQDQQVQASTLLPVGTAEDALTALHLVLPDLGAQDGGKPDLDSVIGLAMAGTGSEGGFTASPPAARRLDPWQWRQRGVRSTPTALLIRRGLFVKELFVIPHERTQSLRISQGPLQRRLHLASVTVHSTKGPVTPVADHLDVDDALALLDAQAERARQRRKVQTPEQWALAVGLESAGTEATTERANASKGSA